MTIFIIAIALELALMAYSLVTKSRQEKTQSILHIIAFAVFLLLPLALVIEWSFRWYGLAALLFIWAVRGLWILSKSKMQDTEYKTRSVVSRTITAMFLVFISVTPALIFPKYEPLPASGAYEVAITRFTYTDESRIEQFAENGEYRKVNVACWHPQHADGNETYPLVVFSHGGLGTETSNESLYRELASHGYVVCSIGHPYHTLWTKNEDERITFVSMDYIQELQREDAKRDKGQSFRYYQKWMQTRTGDINFVMDTILEKASNGAEGVYSLIDVERIGIMGHSFGGSAALATPRQREDMDVVVALEAPYLYDIVGVNNDEFIFANEPYPVPVLNIYSDASWSHLSEWPQYARNYELLSNASRDVFNLHLPGAGHFSLTDLSLASPLLVRFLEDGESARDGAEYLQDLNKTCREFFDYYLKGLGEVAGHRIH